MKYLDRRSPYSYLPARHVALGILTTSALARSATASCRDGIQQLISKAGAQNILTMLYTGSDAGRPLSTTRTTLGRHILYHEARNVPAGVFLA